MSLASKCKSYDGDSITCKDGFIQLPLCRGQLPSCGCVNNSSIPHCLKDELPIHFIKNDGNPLFYKEKE